MAGSKTETLARYVARIIKEKGLRHLEVKQMSGGKITDGYVRGIMSGKAANLSVAKLKALARGLNVSEDEIFAVARGLPIESAGREEESAYRTVASLMLASLKNRNLMQLLTEVARLAPESHEEAVKLLGYLNARKHRSSRPRGKARRS